ncbi:MAG: S8 family peptidase [Ignavibacteriales bacterium]|nr:S8 family peptidase [Ignavibacteriales bacterium]
MKKFIILFLLIAGFAFQITAQQKILVPYSSESIIESELVSKIASSELFEQLKEKKYLKQLNPGIEDEKLDYILLTIYFDEKPAPSEFNRIENIGVELFPESWIPAMQNHPYGFMIAKIPIDKVNTLLSENSVIKVGSAETLLEPNNNQGTTSIKANLLWNEGYTGTGVKVAILDSGLDTEPLNSDLPTTIEKRDYSNYPISIDNNVENTVSGHGTHVTGSVLGRGTLSSLNTINGGGSYKGSAPDADLVFLKIGSDANSNATGAAMISAIQSAVDTFDADIISMSYGGWYAHHDGSSAEEQTVDWAYTQGVPVFMAAGNDGNRGRHYSGTVNANSETDFIQLNVTAGTNNTALFFNLVWSDGSARNNLSLSYYDEFQLPLPGITIEPTIESFRGTESQFSNYGFYTLSGNRTFYLKVVNPSNVAQTFHIYDRWGARVAFQIADPFYTIGQPASADNCISVGAYTSSVNWTAYDGSNQIFTLGGPLNDIAPFSSRGPRIDGLLKPNITAPGTAIISIRDRDVLFSTSRFWVDNDGVIGGDANYYVMQGTSMATPLTAGAVALLLQKFPGASPLQIYNAIQDSAFTDSFTGIVPNDTWGYGKLDINAASSESELPVELTSFSALAIGQTVKLNWNTATEINNYGFEIERKVASLQSAIYNYEKIGFINGNGNSNSPKSYSYQDNGVSAGKYLYRLKQIDNDGQFEYSEEIEIDLGLPTEYELTQNYPNPFNPSTKIRYSIPNVGSGLAQTVLKVYDVLGNEIATLVDDYRAAGSYEVEFDASSLSTGVYFYKLQSGSFVETKR